MCKSEPKQLTVVGVCRFKDGIIYDDINSHSLSFVLSAKNVPVENIFSFV